MTSLQLIVDQWLKVFHVGFSGFDVFFLLFFYLVRLNPSWREAFSPMMHIKELLQSPHGDINMNLGELTI